MASLVWIYKDPPEGLPRPFYAINQRQAFYAFQKVKPGISFTQVQRMGVREDLRIALREAFIRKGYPPITAEVLAFALLDRCPRRAIIAYLNGEPSPEVERIIRRHTERRPDVASV